MYDQQIEHRNRSSQHYHEETSKADIVRKALAVQSRSGTTNAVEYLKSCNVQAEVINRVLSGSSIRLEDKEFLNSLGNGFPV
jgi:hypothetical protein